MEENRFKDSEDCISFKVTEKTKNLESYLKRVHNISSRLIRKAVKDRNLYLNYQKVKRNKSVDVGDIISIILGDEEDNNLPQADVEVDIIYEDLDFLAINKQPYAVVHATKSHYMGTIANGIAYYFMEKDIRKKVRFINRLDRDTSGVLLIGKNSFGHQQISEQLSQKSIKKTYMTLVDGIVEVDSDTIDAPIEREDGEDSKIRIVRSDGKRAITHYEVVERYKDATLLKVVLETGRTHQIRVHLKHIGHPIIGDTLYFEESPYIGRQALHAYSVNIVKPRDGQEVVIRAELPQDMLNLIEKLKK